MRNPAKVDLKNLSLFPFILSRIGLQIWIFVFLMSLTLMLLGFQFSGRSGLWMGFLISAFFLTLFFFFSTPALLTQLQCSPVRGSDPDNLKEMTVRFSKLLGVATPDIYVFPSRSVTGFALSQGINSSSIAVSSELLRRLTESEREVVIALLVGFIKSHSHFNFNLASGFAHSLIGFAQLLDSYWPTNWSAQKHLQFRPFLYLSLPVAGTILRFAQTTQKHFANDEVVTQVLNDKNRLAQVLWKLDAYSHSLPLDIPPGTHHFFVTNPEGSRESNWFFESHPKMDQRIRRLAGHYPI